MPLAEVDSKLLPPLKNDPAKTNWWEKVGGLPSLVTRVAKHLVSEREFTESHAIATAISQIRKVCATGRTFGGRTAVKEATKAEYCAAAAEIEAKRAAAKGKSVAEYELSDEDALAVALAAKEELSTLSESIGVEWIVGAIAERDFSTTQRKKSAQKGHAMADGSFPIENAADLKNAVRAIGRAPESKRAAVKAHIKKRAKELKVKEAIVPENWELVEEISEEILTLSSLVEVYSPEEGLSEAFVIPPLKKLQSQVRANRKSDEAKSKSKSSSGSKTKHAPAGSSKGGQFISNGGTGPIISGVRKKLGINEGANAAKTKARVEAFQKKNGLAVDGIIGRQTATFLLSQKKVSTGKITTGIRSRLKRRFG